MNAYKILSIILGVLLLVAGGAFLYEKYSRDSDNVDLRNKIAKLEGTVKETETAYSKRALEIEDLKSENEELQSLVDERDEEILAISEIAFSWKDRYYKIKNAEQTIESKNTSETVIVSANCEKCLAENRIRVSFEHEEDPLRVRGFTLTSPPEAEIKLEWTRKLKLDLILAKNEDDSFRVYIDPGSSDLGEAELILKVDPSIFDYRWFQKIGIGLDFNVGEDGIISGIRVFYDVTENIYVGPNVVVLLDGFFRSRIFYGAVIGWYPFR